MLRGQRRPSVRAQGLRAHKETSEAVLAVNSLRPQRRGRPQTARKQRAHAPAHRTPSGLPAAGKVSRGAVAEGTLRRSQCVRVVMLRPRESWQPMGFGRPRALAKPKRSGPSRGDGPSRALASAACSPGHLQSHQDPVIRVQLQPQNGSYTGRTQHAHAPAGGGCRRAAPRTRTLVQTPALAASQQAGTLTTPCNKLSADGMRLS